MRDTKSIPGSFFLSENKPDTGSAVYVVAQIFAGLIGFSVIAVVYTLFNKFRNKLLWLTPPLFFPDYIGGEVRLTRIFSCDVVLWIIGAAVPLLLVGSGLFMTPAIYWHTPESNGFIFFVMMLCYIGLATIVYWIFSTVKKDWEGF